MLLQQLIDNKAVKAVRNGKAPKGVYVILNRNADGKVVSTDTLYPNNPIKQNAIYDMKHPLHNHQSDEWSEHKVVAERSSKENVKAAVEFIKTWLSQGKDTNEKIAKAEVFAKFVEVKGKTEIKSNQVLDFLSTRGEESEALLVKFITTTIQVSK